MLISFTLGIIFGLLIILSRSAWILNSTDSWFPLYISAFLTSIGAWIILPYIMARSKLSKNRKQAALNSMSALIGILFSYHIIYFYLYGYYRYYSLFDAFELYDFLWIIVACIFGLVLGFLVYPAPFTFKEKIINLDHWQRCFIPATCIAEVIWEPIWYKSPPDFELLIELVVGFIFFLIYNHKHLKQPKTYLYLISLTIIECATIFIVYIFVFIILQHFNAIHSSMQHLIN